MTNPSTYAETTDHITIIVQPFYLDEQSEPANSHYVWAYHVRIENNGEKTVQLKTRYWRITDSLGNVQEVRGDGVIGEQPVLDPGAAQMRPGAVFGVVGHYTQPQVQRRQRVQQRRQRHCRQRRRWRE